MIKPLIIKNNAGREIKVETFESRPNLAISLKNNSYNISMFLTDEDINKLAVRMMQHLTNDQRMDIMNNFCTHCGDKNPKCQCWNDA